MLVRRAIFQLGNNAFLSKNNIQLHQIEDINFVLTYFKQEPSMYTVKGVLILDNDGERILSKVRHLFILIMIKIDST